MILKTFEGKHVFLKIYPNTVYHGVVKEVEWVGYDDEGKSLYLVSIVDKFGKFIGVNSREIKFIEEQNPELEEVKE